MTQGGISQREEWHKVKEREKRRKGKQIHEEEWKNIKEVK